MAQGVFVARRRLRSRSFYMARRGLSGRMAVSHCVLAMLHICASRCFHREVKPRSTYLEGSSPCAISLIPMVATVDSSSLVIYCEMGEGSMVLTCRERSSSLLCLPCLKSWEGAIGAILVRTIKNIV